MKINGQAKENSFETLKLEKQLKTQKTLEEIEVLQYHLKYSLRCCMSENK
jgi:hypothetical protein